MKADIILKSDAIFTGLEGQPFKGSMAIAGKNIVYVGREEVPASWIQDETKVFELGSRLIVPGLSETHMHYLLSATILSKYCCNLVDTKSEEECVELMKDFREKNPNLDKLIGFGWFPINWTESKVPHALPSKESLDAVFPDISVYLLMADCHTFWCNTKALKICNITKDMEYSFGYLGLGEDEEPNGILSELELMAPCFNQFYDFPDDISEDMQMNLLNELAKQGLTSFTDVAECTVLSGDSQDLKKIKLMERKGKLTIRANVYPSLGITGDLSLQKAMRRNYSSDMVKIPGLKQFFDGVTSTYSACLIEPYRDKPETEGRMNYDETIFDHCIVEANQAGFGIKIHCIGDYAVRKGLDIFEHSKNVNPNYMQCRNSIEHIESIHYNDIPRFRQLNVTASVQPVHLPLDANEKIDRIGMERCEYEWPFRSMIDMGLNLAFGSDSPVSGLNPYENIYTAVTRKDLDGADTGVNPQEKITVAEALRAYTYGSAYSHNREDELGTLEVGKLADVTVIDRNLFDIPEEEIKDCKASLTIVNGKVVYSDL
ncbi:amidohydrolase [Sinanaerobacter chloroacetimidivorans]|uniref:Amidohydrolase n=1 Tax=Sinanaerobacter chloroacetimidivorans TaxID=2818044 RepID=A0A8J8B1A3_9FIRM|nr:amidohydrolase [Sinanaerobacter chloroacetimidivorans]MBR0597446.1 amidohydrolase [Sinanaerobacter chloroacetimidivorans]